VSPSEGANVEDGGEVGSGAADCEHRGAGGGLGVAGVKPSGPYGAALRAGLDLGSAAIRAAYCHCAIPKRT
jgi:hypothetical protein